MAWTVACAILGGGCGGAPPVGSVKHRGTKAIAPWAFGEEAAEPTTAVILGTAPGTAPEAATGAAGSAASSTVLEVKAQGRATVEVAGEQGVQRIELVATARARQLPGIADATQRDGLALSIAGGAAARLLGKEPEAYEWSVAGGGGEDVAAEAMMAVGFVAGLTGGSIDSKAVVLAAVLPDGSLGMVDGLPERVALMAAAGKQRIGVPAAAAVSSKSGKVAALPRKGVEVVVLRDVAAAVAFATGSALPATLEAKEAELALTGAETDQLAATYAAWQQRIAAEWAALLLLDNAARLPAKIGQLAAVAQREAKAAEELRVAGAWSAAIDRLIEAAAVSSAAVTAFRVVELVQQGELDDAVAALQERDAFTEAAAVTLAIGEAARPTSGEQLHHLALAGAALAALAHAKASAAALEAASAELREMKRLPPGELGSAATARRVTSAVVPALLASRRAAAAAEDARRSLDLHDVGGGPARSAEELARVQPAERTLEQWRGAVDPSSRPPSGSPLVYPEAAMIELAATWPPELAALRTRWGERAPQWLLTRWAASLFAAQLAAQALAERDSFGGRRDPVDGSLTLPGGPAASALPALLAAADRHARQAATAARIATGAIPLAQRLAYQRGRQLARRSEPALQVRALYALWWSTAVGEAAVRLARAARPLPRTI